jgi:hypothetical protein
MGFIWDMNCNGIFHKAGSSWETYLEDHHPSDASCSTQTARLKEPLLADLAGDSCLHSSPQKALDLNDYYLFQPQSFPGLYHHPTSQLERKWPLPILYSRDP